MKWKGVFFLLSGLLLGVLLGFAALYFLRQPAAPASRAAPPTVGSPAPDFTLPVLGGSSQKLSDLRGKPLLVNFWATWCLPCKEEMPLLQKTADAYAGQMAVVGINSGEEDGPVKEYLKEVGVRFPILMDRDQKVSDLYFARNFPMTLFIDQDGVIRGMHLGTLTEDTLPRYLSTIGIPQ